MDLSTLVPLPICISLDFCKRDAYGNLNGFGVAVCRDLLVISSSNELQVFALPDDIARGHLGTPRALAHVRTLGGVGPMEFVFSYGSGNMAFTDGCGETTLLVTDNGHHGAVHVVDVVNGTHAGYVAAPGTITWPRAVTTRKSLAAVSCWEVVRLFEGSGGTWTPVRTIVLAASGLCFTADGSRLAVARRHKKHLCIFCAKDGALLRLVDLPLKMDCYHVEECNIGDSDGDGSRVDWVMCQEGGLVAIAGNTNTVPGWRNLDFKPFCLAVLPGVGLVVRHDAGVQVLATHDAIAMAAMSACKVAWMTAVCRGPMTGKHRFS